MNSLVASRGPALFTLRLSLLLTLQVHDPPSVMRMTRTHDAVRLTAVPYRTWDSPAGRYGTYGATSLTALPA